MKNPLLRPQAATAGFFMGNYMMLFIVFVFMFCQKRKKSYLCRIIVAINHNNFINKNWVVQKYKKDEI